MQRHQSNTILHLSSLTHLDVKYLSGACRLISHTRLTKARFSPRTNYMLIHYMKVINCYNARPRFVSSSAKFGYRRKTVVSDRGRSKSSVIRERRNEYLSQSTLASCYMTGFAHFFRPKIQGLFKDFQGPNFEISRTSFLFTSMNLPIEMVRNVHA